MGGIGRSDVWNGQPMSGFPLDDVDHDSCVRSGPGPPAQSPLPPLPHSPPPLLAAESLMWLDVPEVMMPSLFPPLPCQLCFASDADCPPRQLCLPCVADVVGYARLARFVSLAVPPA